MDPKIPIIKGIHPGIILERELKERGIKKGRFALSINEFPQTIASITKGKRRINPALSLKIERALEMEEGFFMVLQAYYDIEQEKRKEAGAYHPDLTKLRPVVFWDTDINLIDWEKNKPAVIKRVFERGNEEEITEIIRFYGTDAVKEILDSAINLLPQGIENREKYLQTN